MFFPAGESEVEIRWFVPQNQESGTYRISHFGAHKTLLKGHIKYYSGVTNSFEVSIVFIVMTTGSAMTKRHKVKQYLE